MFGARKHNQLLESIYSHSLVLPRLIDGVKPHHLSVCPLHGVIWMKESEDQVEEELWAFKLIATPDKVTADKCRHTVWTKCYGQNSMDMSTLPSRQLNKILNALDKHLARGVNTDDND